MLRWLFEFASVMPLVAKAATLILTSWATKFNAPGPAGLCLFADIRASYSKTLLVTGCKNSLQS